MSEALISAADAGEAIPLHALRRQDLEAFLARRRPGVRAQAEAAGFKGSAGQTCAVLRADGRSSPPRPARASSGRLRPSCRPATTA